MTMIQIEKFLLQKNAMFLISSMMNLQLALCYCKEDYIWIKSFPFLFYRKNYFRKTLNFVLVIRLHTHTHTNKFGNWQVAKVNDREKLSFGLFTKFYIYFLHEL